MSVESTSDDEQPEVDEKAVPEVVRKPTRTAGDLSEAAGYSAGIIPEELLRRVRRIEEYLGIASTGPYDTPIAKEISDLKESMRRVERYIANMPRVPGGQISPRENPAGAAVSDTFELLAKREKEDEEWRKWWLSQPGVKLPPAPKRQPEPPQGT
jgi:hypothetical protein